MVVGTLSIFSMALLIKGMNFSLTQRRKDAKVRVLKIQFGNFIPRFSNAQWMKPILPFLNQGGKTVALILALGIVSIPLLMMSGSVSVATILAIGCTIVAIFK